MAIFDTLALIILCILFGYQLGINKNTLNNNDNDTQTDETAKWVGLHLHDDISEDGNTLHLPLDNLPPGALQIQPAPPQNSHGGPYYCHHFGCDEYATHPSPRCRHQTCHGHHCVTHCRTICCPYRSQRIYSDE
jgi:hypothetical protein